MEKKQFIQSAARVVVAAVGMGLVAAADEGANHEHDNERKKKNVVGWALLGAVCQGIMECYYHSKKKEEQ
jgi:hypothetical protein